MVSDLKEDKGLTAKKVKLQEAKNLLACKRAGKDYLSFLQLMHPHREHHDDYTKSDYIVKEFHRVIADAANRVENGTSKRIIISVPPRYGKTETAAKKLIAYILGRDPRKHVIYATYGGDLSKECGEDVKHTMQTRRFKSVFDVKLRKSGAAKDRVQTEEGGIGIFVGRGGAVGGKGAHVLIVDDIVKDDLEANSPTTMDQIWNWYNKVANYRLMDDKSAIIIIMTRWNDNDLIGRITCPESPNYDPTEAAKWEVIKIPAMCEDEDEDPMGRKLGEPLWPERFSKEHLEGLRRIDPRAFACLQQQNPTPDDGVFFTQDMFRKEFLIGEQPEGLRIYGASDHAVATKQHNDMTCMLIVGVDAHDNIWLLDCFWARVGSPLQVDAMLNLIRKWNPITWWAEDGQISKSILPFLRKRMIDEKVFCTIDPVTVPTDKEQRAQSIKGWMSMGKVYWPRDLPWYQPAKTQLLRFTGGSRFDDFVDTIAHIGQQLTRLVKGAAPTNGFKPAGYNKTFGALKDTWKREKQARFALQGARF